MKSKTETGEQQLGIINLWDPAFIVLDLIKGMALTF